MKRYPKTEKYDEKWISDNWMGPNPLWLLEEICEHLDLQPGMRVLDMGCGKGLTSVFLAKEYGVTVFANDLWIPATENFQRFKEAGVSDTVFALHADARSLPYPEEFFDVAISIDSYQYYGTDELYFPTIFSKLVKPGGQFGIVVPGFTKDFEAGYPETLKKYWIDEMFSFKSSDWWRRLWEKTEIVEIKECYNIENPKEIWLPYAINTREWAIETQGYSDEDFLNDDINNDIALIAMVARKRG